MKEGGKTGGSGSDIPGGAERLQRGWLEGAESGAVVQKGWQESADGVEGVRRDCREGAEVGGVQRGYREGAECSRCAEVAERV